MEEESDGNLGISGSISHLKRTDDKHLEEIKLRSGLVSMRLPNIET